MYILGNIKIEGVTYYIDQNKYVYIKENEKFLKVKNEQTLRKILDYITPKSLDNER